MTQEHPITPPPELVLRWFLKAKAMPVDQWVTDVATQAARWGADQELEACCEIAVSDPVCGTKHQRRMLVDHIRKYRRPKPPSLKEQALEGLTRIESTNDFFSNQMKDLATIRRALEALDD